MRYRMVEGRYRELRKDEEATQIFVSGITVSHPYVKGGREDQQNVIRF